MLSTESKGKFATWLPICLALLTFLFGGGWFQQCQKTKKEKHDAQTRLVSEYLQPILTSLEITNETYEDLSSKYCEGKRGILECYLTKIRSSGIPSNAIMKQKLITIIENDSKILALLTNYDSYAVTENYKIQATLFRTHATRYIERWNAIPDIKDTKEQLITEVPFPQGFTRAIEEELKLQKGKN